MWRFLAGIPRGLRQQIQCNVRQRPACIDDERNNRGQEIVCRPLNYSYNVPRCRYSGYHGEHKNRNDEKGPGHEQFEWRKPNFDFWGHLNEGRHCALEAVGWGAAVVLGIHLSKLSQLHGDLREFSRGQLPVCGLLYRVALASPQLDSASSGKHIRPAGQTQASSKQIQAEGKKTQKAVEGPNALDLVFTEFEDLCQKYTATGNNIAGLQRAAQNNMTAAVQHWAEASKLGSAKAQFNLGLCYESGNGVKKNITEAVKQYKLAASSDHAEAMYNLALIHLRGDTGVAQDTTKALHFMEKAAALGLAQAQTYLGVYYAEGEKQDLPRAVALFKSAAAQEDAEAKYFLGICHEQGWGTDQNECKAAEYYRQASASGHDGALYNLAVFHEYGLGGLPVNVDAAIALYEQSAEVGNEQATHSLNRLRAVEATAEWNRQEFAQEMSGPSLRESSGLRSPASSPSLTDYVREHLDQLTSTSELPWIHVDHLALARSFLSMDRTADTPQFSVGGSNGLTVGMPFTTKSPKIRSAAEPMEAAAKFTLGEPEDLTQTIDFIDTGQSRNALFTIPKGLTRPASLYDLRVACT